MTIPDRKPAARGETGVDEEIHYQPQTIPAGIPTVQATSVGFGTGDPNDIEFTKPQAAAIIPHHQVQQQTPTPTTPGVVNTVVVPTPAQQGAVIAQPPQQVPPPRRNNDNNNACALICGSIAITIGVLCLCCCIIPLILVLIFVMGAANAISEMDFDDDFWANVTESINNSTGG